MSKHWVVGVVVMALCAGAAQGAWQAKEQPELGRALQSARELPREEVSDTINSVTLGELMRVPNPDGKTIDILQWYFRSYSGPTMAVVIDTGSGEVKTVSIPDNLQIHICGWVIGRDGKLYITTPWWYAAERKGMELMVYDPATNKLEQRGVIAPKLGYENRPMTVGTNGKIYGASTYPDEMRVGVYEIDTDTGKITDFGPIGPSYRPVGCWVTAVAADDRYVYVATRNNPRYIMVLDRETRQSKVLVTAENVGGSTSVQQHRYGVTGSATKVVGAADPGPKRYWLYKGEAIEMRTPDEKPPWPVPGPEEPWVKMPAVEIFANNALPESDGSAEIWYRIGGARPGATPEEQGWVRITYKVPVYPTTLNHLVELADGRIFGTATGYGGGNFIYDPATGKTEVLGKITGLSQYCRLQHGGKVYMSGYPSSPLYIYDPAKPWTMNVRLKPGQRPPAEFSKQNNPWFAVRLREFAGTHYARSAVAGADGKIYFGGVWARDAASGGLAWWDPQTEKAGGFWQDLSNVAVNHLATTDGGRLIVMAASPVPDRLLNKPMPEQGRLIIYDVTQGKIVQFIEPLPGVKDVGRIADAGSTRVIGLANDPADRNASILYGVDVATSTVAFRKPIPAPFAGGDFRIGPDGAVWTFLGEVLVRILPADATIEVVGKVGRPGHIAFSGGDIYLGGANKLRRIRGAYKPAK